MINILSYVGMNMQAEVCLWTVLGLVRTIFDATLFKVNANLKQVWQMSMPVELSMPVQQVLRTMISGIMLVQCFTVYVYLASYIVLLYPVFLEEHPALLLPWLLLAAIRKLLCELTSLAIGLGTCVLLGNAKPPCIKFLIYKICAIMPAFYMWLLVYSYYHALKVASAFKSFPVPADDPDYGLELAVRRRRTKSLFTEEHLRKKLVAGYYAERSLPRTDTISPRVLDNAISSAETNDSGSSIDVSQLERDVLQTLHGEVRKYPDINPCDEYFGKEIVIPRSDRILEQFVTMLLRISAYLNKDEGESIKSQMFNLNNNLSGVWAPCENIETISDETDTPPLVGNSKGRTASYLREYPHIFMKKLSSEAPTIDVAVNQLQKRESHITTIQHEHNERTLLTVDKKTSNTSIGLIQNKTPDSSLMNILKPLKLNEQNQTNNIEEYTLDLPEIPHGKYNENKIIDDSRSLKREVNQDIIASSQELILPVGESVLHSQETYDNSSKLNDDITDVVPLTSSSKRNEDDQKRALTEENRKIEADEHNNQLQQHDISKAENTQSPSEKLKQD